MADDVRITNFPSEKNHYRVAYDLMKDIMSYEISSANPPTPETAREYFMNLYNQCYQVVYNNKDFNAVSQPKKSGSSGFHSY